MAFKNLGQTPDGTEGSTYINVDHIAEVVFYDNTNSRIGARVTYIGGGVTEFDEDVVEELKAIIDAPPRQAQSFQGRT